MLLSSRLHTKQLKFYRFQHQQAVIRNCWVLLILMLNFLECLHFQKYQDNTGNRGRGRSAILPSLSRVVTLAGEILSMLFITLHITNCFIILLCLRFFLGLHGFIQINDYIFCTPAQVLQSQMVPLCMFGLFFFFLRYQYLILISQNNQFPQKLDMVLVLQ